MNMITKKALRHLYRLYIQGKLKIDPFAILAFSGKETP